MIRFVRSAVAALTILLIGAGLLTPALAQDAPNSSGSAEAGEYVHSWALAPAGSTDPNQPGNRQEMAYDAAPGTTIEDAVILSNLGNVQLDFSVYATDAYNDADGGFSLLDGAAGPTDVGTWIALAQTSFTVPPQTEVTVPITITVPADARAGDHVGAILASSPAPGRAANGQIVPIDRRTGPRLFIRVAGPLTPQLAVQHLSTSYDSSLNPFGGNAHVRFDVANLGNVRTSGSYEVKVGGPFGIAGKTISGEVPELVPGGAMTVDLAVDGVPAGVIDSTTVELTSAPVNGGGTETVSSSARMLAVPWLLVAMVVIAVLLAFVVSRYRRHAHPSAGGGPRSGIGPGKDPRSGLPTGQAGPTARAGSSSAPVLQARR